MNSLPVWYVLLILNSWALGDDINRGNVPLASYHLNPRQGV